MSGIAKRENALLGAALLLVPAGSANSGIKAELVERLFEAFRLHDLGVKRRARNDRIDAPGKPLLVHMRNEFETKLPHAPIAKRYHVPELPGRVDVKKGKRQLAGIKSL